jgi:hypothetical protein
LIDSKPDIFDEFKGAGFIFFLSLFDGFEEEFDEALQGVLIHVINDAQGYTQEI